MRTSRCKLTAVVAALGIATACVVAAEPVRAEPPYAPPPVSVTSINFFVDALAPYGMWVAVSPYGRVWRPYGVTAGWRPYTHGHWEYTDYGWTWISEWEWGWGPFHYGRWAMSPAYGWVWIPGDVWGPAWVAWRYGSDWVGWAPLPPGVYWQAGVGLVYGSINLSVAIGGDAWCFVETRYFLQPQLWLVIAPQDRRHRLLRRTQMHTHYGYVNQRIVNDGVPVRQVERARGHPVRRTPVTRVDRPIRGHPPGPGVRIYRPDFRRGRPPQPRPRARPQPGRRPPAARPPTAPGAVRGRGQSPTAPGAVRGRGQSPTAPGAVRGRGQPPAQPPQRTEKAQPKQGQKREEGKRYKGGRKGRAPQAPAKKKGQPRRRKGHRPR